ncbi:MAG: 1-deoxy-D-xylulose-5-phosphate reductoisomerase [Gammaproteobacteria bacterium]|nr:1-deoxy-D-xylulose-5-phosphate reductoisomerase [Gammaproteobacteria bacterium]MBU1656097.1 1-deoxy-D-xylulose-5-phosphate reductoisomerase [Gammaproteobacteria bacterium]MBU1962182.1 1-deoxy-D-xylulose-5-phosphate reductoisomerase [Gammaproteobacteria bacterium]
MIGVCILGSTGSIGVSTLDVVARHPDRYRVVALTANSNVDGIHRQCLDHRPRFAVMSDPDAAARLRGRLAGTGIEVLAGMDGLEQVAADPDAPIVMAAIVGAAGLLPALAAVRAGKRLLLANKEALVVSGRLFMDEAVRHGAQILPIDSEHNAVFQCMPGDYARGLDRIGVRRILLTASGGPFRAAGRETLAQVTPEQACAHPNWRMGRKISVDSATLMNKGLEVIEACWLFGTGPDRVEVVVHPQSVIHSLVEYVDGSVLAQLGNPDMRTPIAHAMAWPERIASGVAPLDLFAVARLDFEAPDRERFPCLRLAYEAVTAGGGMPAVLNAANEVAVEAFLDRRLPFLAIPALIEETLGRLDAGGAATLDALLDLDRRAREMARSLIDGFGTRSA